MKLRCRTLVGTCGTAVLFFLQKVQNRLENQGNMSYEGTPSKSTSGIQKEGYAAHSTRARSRPSRLHWQTEVEDLESGSYDKEFEEWIARDTTVIARLEQYLNKG